MGKASERKVEIGRLAFRDEGEWWNAYWCPLQTSMDGALKLASIRMSVVGRKGDPVYEGFMALMRTTFEMMTRETIGATPTWGTPRPAPESERAR